MSFAQLFQVSYTVSSGVINHAFVVDENTNWQNADVNEHVAQETKAVIVIIYVNIDIGVFFFFLK